MEDHEALVQALRHRLARGDGSLAALVEERSPEEVAVALLGLEDEEVEGVFARLREEDAELSVAVLSLLDAHDVRRVLKDLPDERVADILEDLPADDATWMLELLEPERVDGIVGAMEEAEGREVRERLDYPAQSAGRLMSDEYLALSPEATAGDAIARLREAGEQTTIVYVYLVDERGHLTGVVSLRRLIRVEPGRRLAELSPEDVVSVSVFEDQEEVARLFERFDLVCMPVVDEDLRLVGVVTHDDILDVVRDEATEDMLAMAGTTPTDALVQSVWKSAQARMPWLFFCLLGGVVTFKILDLQEERLGGLFILLSYFVPVIVGMGGNAGTQAATLVVRGLATGRIQRHDSASVVWKELRTACLVGAGYGLLLAVAAFLLLDVRALFCGVVGLALAAAMLMAALLGSMLPILFHAMDVDPAVATGPLVTTSVDVIGVLTYLSLAGWLLL